MTITQIPPDRLTRLRADGHDQGASERFVDPHVLDRLVKVLHRRGELWAAAILGREVSRRSAAYPDLPWLNSGENYALLLADAEETRLAAEAIATTALADDPDPVVLESMSQREVDSLVAQAAGAHAKCVVGPWLNVLRLAAELRRCDTWANEVSAKLEKAQAKLDRILATADAKGPDGYVLAAALRNIIGNVHE